MDERTSIYVTHGAWFQFTSRFAAAASSSTPILSTPCEVDEASQWSIHDFACLNECDLRLRGQAVDERTHLAQNLIFIRPKHEVIRAREPNDAHLRDTARKCADLPLGR